jgi:choline dehydrogenase-like flavoprotein
MAAPTVVPHEPRPLDIIIAGAGIGGLTAAIGLRQAGHHVQIFESSRFAKEVGAAIHLPPNVQTVLRRWGVNPDEFGANDWEWVRCTPSVSGLFLRTYLLRLTSFQWSLYDEDEKLTIMDMRPVWKKCQFVSHLPNNVKRWIPMLMGACAAAPNGPPGGSPRSAEEVCHVSGWERHAREHPSPASRGRVQPFGAFDHVRGRRGSQR